MAHNPAARCVVPSDGFQRHPRRWEMLRGMAGAGPLAIRAIARLVGRDVKTVHGDVQALIGAGVLDRTEDGRVLFPYDAVHVDFVLRAA
jgi:predicted transcriptional regulator